MLEQMLRAHGEKELRSVKDEPLGKAKVHSGALPAHVTGKDYRFGVKSSKTEAAKSLLYPATDPDAESKAPKRTARYRGVQKPGEQRTRGYNWDNTTVANPTTHRFGMTDPYALRDGEGAALALRPDIDTAIPKRSVVPKRVADFQQVSKDHLGRAKNLGYAVHWVGAATAVVCCLQPLTAISSPAPPYCPSLAFTDEVLLVTCPRCLASHRQAMPGAPQTALGATTHWSSSCRMQTWGSRCPRDIATSQLTLRGRLVFPLSARTSQVETDRQTASAVWELCVVCDDTSDMCSQY